MKFDLVKYTALSRENFKQASTWAQYYQPEDIETLVQLGYERNEVTKTLEAVGWSDEYWFVVPDKADIGSFMFEYRKARFTTPADKKISGFVVDSGHCICLFGSKSEWVININLLDMLNEEINEIMEDIGLQPNDALLSLKVEVLAKNIEFTFG